MTSREKKRISVAHSSFYTVLILFIIIVIPLFGIITKIPKYHLVPVKVRVLPKTLFFL
jgi:hypothetical protein